MARTRKPQKTSADVSAGGSGHETPSAPESNRFSPLDRTAFFFRFFLFLTGIPRSFLDQRRVLAQNAKQAADRGPGTVRPAILTHRAGVSAVVASMAASGGAESPFRARRSPGGAAKLATETLLEAGGAMFWRRPTSWRGWTRVVRRCDNELSVCAFMLSRSGPSRAAPMGLPVRGPRKPADGVHPGV